jgi:hypothetical protein
LPAEVSVSTRLTSSLALAAFALAACPAPTATLAAKQAQLDRLTDALSFQTNPRLKQAADNLNQVNTNLSAPGFKRAQGAVGNIVAQGGGNIVASGGGNLVAQGGGNFISTNGAGFISANGGALQALGRAVAGLGLKLPALAGARPKLFQAADVQVAADPASGELARLWNADASLGFKYTATGNRHQEEITLGGMRDGTTGSLLLDLTAAGWHDASLPTEDSFDGYGQDPYDDGYGDGEPIYFHTTQAGGIHFMGDLAPDDPQRVTLAARLVPRGVAADQLHADLTLDEVKLLGAAGPTATHLKVGLGVPTLDFAGEMRLAAEGVGSLKGSFTLEPRPGAQESFTYALDTDGPHGTASLQVDHPASQVRLRLETRGDEARMGLYAMEDDAKIADLAATPGQPGVLTLTYVDGTVKRWAPLAGAPANPVSGPTGSPTPVPRPF